MTTSHQLATFKRGRSGIAIALSQQALESVPFPLILKSTATDPRYEGDHTVATSSMTLTGMNAHGQMSRADFD
jgi:hypothetical protein